MIVRSKGLEHEVVPLTLFLMETATHDARPIATSPPWCQQAKLSMVGLRERHQDYSPRGCRPLHLLLVSGNNNAPETTLPREAG